MTVNDKDYQVLRLVGKGKGGYCYLVTDGDEEYILKQIHHEPCAYYQFGDKLACELRDYATLQSVGIPMPRLLAVDEAQERLLKSYIPGKTIYERICEGESVQQWFPQLEQMCAKLYDAGLNIDYFPTNFIPHQGMLYYVDYECNPYDAQWDFAHWGSKYWSRTEEFFAHQAQKGATT